MELNLYLLLALLIALLVIGYLLAKLHRVRGQLSLIKDARADIKTRDTSGRTSEQPKGQDEERRDRIPDESA